MSKTVISAFNDFQKNTVNLDPNDVSVARSSRDWLVQQIFNFQEKYDDFPKLYKDKQIFFGSFARRTKKRTLNDIDIIFTINANGSTYSETNGVITIYVPQTTTSLYSLTNDENNVLNSRKVLNLFKNKLSSIPQYSKSDLKSSQEAVVLKLLTYDWVFDIVPAFFTSEDDEGRTYYIIPDGKGNWKKTDPRIDRDRVQEINQKNKLIVLDVVRLVKYWNSRPTMPSIPSYLLECMILNYYEKIDFSLVSDYVDIEFIKILNYIKDNIYCDLDDPKGIQGNLNNLDFSCKYKVSQRASSDIVKAEGARRYENEKNHKESIKKWREIFGSDFPDYE